MEQINAPYQHLNTDKSGKLRISPKWTKKMISYSFNTGSKKMTNLKLRSDTVTRVQAQMARADGILDTHVL